MRVLRLGILVLAVGLCGGPAAHADLLYEFNQANYSVAAGGSVLVDVFLHQTDPTAILSTVGLSSAGVRVHFDEPPLPSQPAKVLGLGDLLGNAAFNDPASPVKDLVANHSAGLFEFGDLDPAHFTGVFAVGDRILLGTFRFTAGSIGGQVTHLRAGDFNAQLDDTVAMNGDVLDRLIADGSATITVEQGTFVIPEPSALLLLGCGALGLLGRGWRRNARARNMGIDDAYGALNPYFAEIQ